jgi:hypothetical protein
MSINSTESVEATMCEDDKCSGGEKENYPTQHEINIQYNLFFPMNLKLQQDRYTTKREGKRKPTPSRKMKIVDGNSTIKSKREYTGVEKITIESYTLHFFKADESGKKTYTPFLTVYRKARTNADLLITLKHFLLSLGKKCFLMNTRGSIPNREPSARTQAHKKDEKEEDTEKLLHLCGKNSKKFKETFKKMLGPFPLPLPEICVETYKNYNFEEQSPFDSKPPTDSAYVDEGYDSDGLKTTIKMIDITVGCYLKIEASTTLGIRGIQRAECKVLDMHRDKIYFGLTSTQYVCENDLTSGAGQVWVGTRDGENLREIKHFRNVRVKRSPQTSRKLVEDALEICRQQVQAAKEEKKTKRQADFRVSSRILSRIDHE